MGSGSIASPFLTSALDGGELSASHPSRFTPVEIAHCTHWIRGWVGPTAGLDAGKKRKILACLESNPGRKPLSLSLYRLSYSDFFRSLCTYLKQSLGIIDSYLTFFATIMFFSRLTISRPVLNSPVWPSSNI
jgi:hypothetical protein